MMWMCSFNIYTFYIYVSVTVYHMVEHVLIELLSAVLYFYYILNLFNNIHTLKIIYKKYILYIYIVYMYVSYISIYSYPCSCLYSTHCTCTDTINGMKNYLFFKY